MLIAVLRKSLYVFRSTCDSGFFGNLGSVIASGFIRPNRWIARYSDDGSDSSDGASDSIKRLTGTGFMTQNEREALRLDAARKAPSNTAEEPPIAK